MIRAVIFDIGGVVVRFTNTDYYHHLSRISGKPYRFIERTIEKGLLAPFESGKMGIDRFSAGIAKTLGIKKSQVQWIEFYKKTVKMNYDVLELVEQLQKEYKTALLTNADIARYRYTTKILNMDLFDYRFQSCYIKARKPDPKIYRYALKKMGLKPEETVFIDNMIENVEGARKVGMNAIHFVGRRRLDKELAEFGL